MFFFEFINSFRFFKLKLNLKKRKNLKKHFYKKLLYTLIFSSFQLILKLEIAKSKHT